jgi:hypothetical protein
MHNTSSSVHSRRTLVSAAVWLLLAALALAGVTYAWFTYSPAVNVEPLSSTVSSGDVQLLISNDAQGTFDTQCVLAPISRPDSLSPLSTADLRSFFAATAQTRDGIALLYRDSTDAIDDALIRGTLYLKSCYAPCDLYLCRTGLDFGLDAQTLSALRLGLRVTTQSGTQTYIFRLDEFASGEVTSVRTVPQENTVVSSLTAQGAAIYVDDPSLSPAAYCAAQTDDNGKPTAGQQSLASLQTDEVATVEYWLWLEGCDDQCSNAVQDRELALQLAFAGVSVG